MSQQFPQQARGFHWRNIRIFDKIFSESCKRLGGSEKIPGSKEPGGVDASHQSHGRTVLPSTILTQMFSLLFYADRV
jgi:hypothetical protein